MTAPSFLRRRPEPAPIVINEWRQRWVLVAAPERDEFWRVAAVTLPSGRTRTLAISPDLTRVAAA